MTGASVNVSEWRAKATAPRPPPLVPSASPGERETDEHGREDEENDTDARRVSGEVHDCDDQEQHAHKRISDPFSRLEDHADGNACSVGFVRLRRTTVLAGALDPLEPVVRQRL